MRETDEPRSERRPVVDPPLFASAVEEPPRRRGGFGIWLAAAFALVIGIVIGFASGYRAGQNVAAKAAVVEPTPREQGPAAASKESGRTFSESAVGEPARTDQSAAPAPVRGGQPAPKPPAQSTAKPAATPRPAAPAQTGQPVPKPASASSPQPVKPPAPPPAAATPRPATTQPQRTTTTPAPSAARPAPAVAEPVAPAPAAGPGSMEVVSRPAGANVLVDGKIVGRTPLTIEVASGRHTVQLQMTGYQQWQTAVDVRPAASTRVAASLEQ